MTSYFHFYFKSKEKDNSDTSQREERESRLWTMLKTLFAIRFEQFSEPINDILSIESGWVVQRIESNSSVV